MQLYIKWIFLLLATSFLSPAYCQVQKTRSPFRIVGYYSLQSAMTDSLNTIPFDKLTHINLWFLNPDSLGNFTQDLSLLLPFVTAAQAKKVKVLVSIGGGSAHPYYRALLKDDKRKMLVANLVKVAADYRLDGIDV